MARPNRQAVALVEPPNSIVASAVNLTNRRTVTSAKGKGAEWQTQAWHYFDTVGEFEFVANWTGNLLSRARLYVTKDGKTVPDTDPGAVALKELCNSASGKADMLRSFGIHFTVAGEGWLVSWEADGKRVWKVVAPQNIQEQSGRYTIEGEVITDSKPLVVRCWDPHPYRAKESNSPARAALPILNEIEKLTMHVAAQTDSRLASAGIFLIPNEITVASAANGTTTEQENATSAQKFVNEFYRAASASLANPDGPGALVPIVLSAEADYLEKIRNVQFWTPLDENAKDLRAEAIRRLALSLDIPPEVLTGTGDANHWSAWAVDEASIKSHSEPLLRRLCADLTEGYLRYAIEGDVADVYAYEIVADTSEMRLRPNRSKEASEMYDRGELTAEAMRRENGFEEADAPNDAALKVWLLKKLASGSSTPEMMMAALGVLGVDLPITAPAADDDGREDRPSPSLEDHPALDPPDVEDIENIARQAALVAAAEQMVFRAMERAGNKMANQFKFTPDGVDPSERYLFYDKGFTNEQAHFLLDGSFSTCDRFAEQYKADPAALAFALDGYCYTLVLGKRPHTTAALAAYLTQMGV